MAGKKYFVHIWNIPLSLVLASCVNYNRSIFKVNEPKAIIICMIFLNNLYNECKNRLPITQKGNTITNVPGRKISQYCSKYKNECSI